MVTEHGRFRKHWLTQLKVFKIFHIPEQALPGSHVWKTGERKHPSSAEIEPGSPSSGLCGAADSLFEH
jgi:hypothetical protein